MTPSTREGLMYIAAMVIAVAAAVGALVLGDEIEVTLLMVSAVVAGLVCFDMSMERRLQAFVPWSLLSVAPVVKTVPAVWLQLQGDDSGALPERYDHVGSLLFGLCLLGAVVALSRPAPDLGRLVAGFDAAVLVGSAAVAGLAGASVAFLVDLDFGGATVGRVLETPTWVVVGGLLAAAAMATSHAREVTFALAGVLLLAGLTAGLLAFTVAGREVDLGIWAMLFALLTIVAAGTGGNLGRRESRDRYSNVAVVAAIIAGLVGAASAISARSDRTSWGPGWALLGVLSMVMFALAMASRPPEKRTAGHTRSGPQDIGIDDDERSARAHARAKRSLVQDLPASAQDLPGPVDPAFEAPGVSAPQPGRVDHSMPRVESPQADEARCRDVSADPAPIEPAPSAAPIEPVPPTAPAPLPQPAESVVVPAAPASTAGPTAAAPPVQPAGVLPAPAQPVLSDASLVSTAQAAAAVRTAPVQQRHTLAPLSQAHHFDPSTGLLSASGLEHALARAFDVPRQAGHITIMVFVIRNLDDIERRHGRLASAAVTRHVADRVTSLLPDGTGARFGRAAYAVVFVGDLSNSTQTVQHLARVLLQLRVPVEGGSLGDKIDVVGGMAQCYEGEDAAQFVKRANQGLARAVQSPEPTFVAMP